MNIINTVASSLILLLAVLSFGGPPDPNTGPVVVPGSLAHNEQGSLWPWSIHNEQGDIHASSAVGFDPPSAGDIAAAFACEEGDGTGQIQRTSTYRVLFIVECHCTLGPEFDDVPADQGIARFQGVWASTESGEMAMGDRFDVHRTDQTGQAWQAVTLDAGLASGDAILGGLEFGFASVDPLSDAQCKLTIRVRAELWRQ